jgi:hypothetical protein
VRLTFVHHVVEDRGSAQDMHNYAEVARALGHDVELYGRPMPGSWFDYSQHVGHADAVVFIFEWTTTLQYGDGLDLARLVATVPRERRVVLDCDGGYNDAISVNGDVNHADAAASRHWVEVCDSLSDKIFQPTLHPLRPNVGSFFFHAYNPAWEAPLDLGGKEYGMCYVGNNWFRWRSLRRVLGAVEPVRDRVGRIALVGHGWDSVAPWASPAVVEDAYLNDPEFLRRLRVEVSPAVPFHRVIECMGKGTFTPVIYRPLFDHLRLVTCRTFETPAASTIPLFCQAPEFVSEIYGDAALELTLPESEPHEKILDLVRRPQHYEGVVADIRSHLRKTYSYSGQLKRLIEIVES